MSSFDFPRIHFNGIMRVNVGTANNDDYSSTPSPNSKNYLYEQKPNAHLRTFDSINVKLPPTLPKMCPNKLLDWMKKDQKEFVHENKPSEKAGITPGYWNYYGSMSVWADGVTVSRVALNQETTIESPNQTDHPVIQRWLGGKLSYDRWPQLPKQPEEGYKSRAEQLTTAIMTDIKSEGSSPGSQIFCDNILFQDASGEPIFYRNPGNSNTYANTGSKPTKSSANWLACQGYESFFAGTNDGNPNQLILNPAAAAVFQCVMPFSPDFVGDSFRATLEEHADPEKGMIQGIVVRYVMYPGVHPINGSEEWEALYKNPNFFDKLNERQCPIVGIIAPWYGEDNDAETPDLASIQIGREIHPVPGLQMATQKWEKGPPALPLTLSPIIAKITENRQTGQYYLSVDIGKSLTSYFPQVAGNLNLSVLTSPSDPPLFLSEIPYGNEDNNRFYISPWKINANPDTQLFDTPRIDFIDIPLTEEQHWILTNMDSPFPGGILILTTTSTNFSYKTPTSSTPLPTYQINGETQYGLMHESRYSIVNNARTLYTEQSAGTIQSSFRYDSGSPSTVSTFQIVQKGRVLTELPTDERFYMVTCKTVPLPNAYKHPLTFTPIERMDDLTVKLDVSAPGSYRFAVVSERFRNYYKLKVFKDLDTLPIVVAQVRILPNEDYSEFYTNPGSSEPVGNAKLNFGVLYEKVLKPYHVLFPAMDQVRNLHDPKEWGGADSAKRLMERIDINNFNRAIFMPRTRDLSESRRQLLEAWCRKTLQSSDTPA